MDAQSENAKRRNHVWLQADAGQFEDFKKRVERDTRASDCPHARDIQSNVPIYAGEDVRAGAADTNAKLDLMAEWNAVFDQGPGIIVIKDAMPDLSVVDAATALFERIIDAEKQAGSGGGDHFAKPGANDRVWNAAEKHCVADPENFAQYYASDAIAMAARAWLGRGYQITAQVNRVNPGGAAQTAHRDYHLGFMTAEQLATYPRQAHAMSPWLTLQGAVAHCDMPVETGPTMLLPYSQTFFEGYVAFNRPEYQDYFAKNHVQLPLEKGDALFFNPATMHGAGTNRTTNVQRMANLLQIGSAFGRSIESVNRSKMALTLYPVLLDALNTGKITPRAAQNAVAAAAEGYAFPTNLDLDPPAEGSLVPLSQAEQMDAALSARKPFAAFEDMVRKQDAKRQP